MVQATQLKRGMCIKHENELYRVVEAQHKTPGNLRGLVQAKIRNLKNGAISEHRFRSVDMVERAILDETEMEFLYQDGDMYHFMNNETFEQIGLPESVKELLFKPRGLIVVDRNAVAEDTLIEIDLIAYAPSAVLKHDVVASTNPKPLANYSEE